MKRERVKGKILEELRKVPIVQVACEKCGLSRNSFYKWKRRSKTFAREVDKALADGEAFVNDMSESQLLQLIKEKNFSAIRFWLNSRHPKFKTKLEVTTKEDQEELTPEQKKVVQKALRLASITKTKSIKKINKDNKKKHEKDN